MALLAQQCRTILFMRFNNDREEAFVCAAVPEGAGGLIDAVPALHEGVAASEAVPIPISARFDPLKKSLRPALSDALFVAGWGTPAGDDRSRIERQHRALLRGGMVTGVAGAAHRRRCTREVTA